MVYSISERRIAASMWMLPHSAAMCKGLIPAFQTSYGSDPKFSKVSTTYPLDFE